VELAKQVAKWRMWRKKWGNMEWDGEKVEGRKRIVGRDLLPLHP
jgi:hypothetical protein